MGIRNKVSWVKDHKGFCVVPFIHMFGGTGGYKLCCQYSGEIGQRNKLDHLSLEEVWQGKDYQELRKKFYQRKLPNGCDECIASDKFGHFSKRVISNMRFSKEADYYYRNKTLVPPPPIEYDLRPSNYCNLECVMCSPHSSSSIQERIEQVVPSSGIDNFHIKPNKAKYRSGVDYINYLKQNINRVQSLQFAGGEPFLMPEVIEFIQWLYETKNSSHIDIRFLTNGTVFRSKWIDYLLSFRNVVINISLDGTGSVLEYVRFPNKWNNVQKNLESYKKVNDNHNVHIWLNPCVHILNLKGLHSVIRTAKDYNFNMNISAVENSNDKDYLRINRLHQHIRDKEADLIEKELTSLTSKDKVYHDKKNLEAFVKRIRNTKFDLGKDSHHFKKIVKYWNTHKPNFLDEYPYLSYLLD